MGDTILFGGSGLLGSIMLRENPDIISVGRTKPLGLSNTHIHVSMDDLTVLDTIDFDKVVFFIGNSNHHILNKSCMSGIEYNVIPLKQVLYYLKGRKIKKFMCLTSILLYGNEEKGYPVSETEQIHPYQNEYLFSKYLAEEVVKFYSKEVPIINIRLSNIYGDTHLQRPDLIPTLVLDCITKDDVSVWNDKPIRDFIFASDACDAILKLLDTDYTGNINLGNGEMHSVREVCDILEKLSGKKIKSLDIEVTGVMKFMTDTSLLEKLTLWYPKHTLEEGITKTYNAMLNHIKNAEATK